MPVCQGFMSQGGGKNLNWWIGSMFTIFWFLKSAFICCLLYYAILYSVKISCRNNRLLILGIITTLIISQFIGLFKVNIMYPCFFLGVMIKKRFEWVKEHDSSITITCGILWLFMLIFWNKSYWDVPGGIKEARFINIMHLSHIQIFRIFYRILIGCVGTMFFISIFQIIYKRIRQGQFGHIINTIGKDTLGIYLIQTIILEILLPHYFPHRFPESFTFDFIYTPIISVIVLVCCLIIIKLLKCNTIIAFLTLGILPKKSNNS